MPKATKIFYLFLIDGLKFGIIDNLPRDILPNFPKIILEYKI